MRIPVTLGALVLSLPLSACREGADMGRSYMTVGVQPGNQAYTREYTTDEATGRRQGQAAVSGPGMRFEVPMAQPAREPAKPESETHNLQALQQQKQQPTQQGEQRGGEQPQSGQAQAGGAPEAQPTGNPNAVGKQVPGGPQNPNGMPAPAPEGGTHGP